MLRKQQIRLLLRSYDHRQLDKTVQEIVLTVKRTGAQLMGPVPLKSRRRRITVNRGPHVDKESREQFELTIHKRLIDIFSPSDKTMNELMKLNLTSGVDIEIKLDNN